MGQILEACSRYQNLGICHVIWYDHHRQLCPRLLPSSHSSQRNGVQYRSQSMSGRPSICCRCTPHVRYCLDWRQMENPRSTLDLQRLHLYHWSADHGLFQELGRSLLWCFPRHYGCQQQCSYCSNIPGKRSMRRDRNHYTKSCTGE